MTIATATVTRGSAVENIPAAVPARILVAGPVCEERAICEKQLLNIVDRLEKIEVDHDEIDSFLPAVNEKLECLNKEELIKHFVAMEFNHFLDYYKSTNDLTTPTHSDLERPKRSQKKGKSNNRDNGRSANYMGGRSRRTMAEQGFTRFYINLGEKDKIKPPDIIGLVNRSTRDRNVNVGRIDILRKFSFFEVDESYTNVVLDGFKKITYNKNDVVVEVSKGEGWNNKPPFPIYEKRKSTKRKNGRRKR